VEHSSRRRAQARLTPRDLDLLAFIAEQRVIVAYHALRFLGVSSSVAYARLRALSAAGLVRSETALHGHPRCYQTTARGVRTVGKRYRTQAIDYGTLQHDLGVTSLALAARAGTFGPLRAVISERAMRSHDASADRAGEPFGVRFGGVGERGHPRLHYPDLMLVTPNDKRIAFELELTSKGARRREKILLGYAFDNKIDAVVYLVRDRSTGQKIQDSARRIGISDLVHVQMVGGLPRAGSASRFHARSAQRQLSEPVR